MTVNRRRLHIARRELMRALGRDLARTREDAGSSQLAIASEAGLDRSHLSRIEAGIAEPSIEALMAIAAALGCDVSVRLFQNTGPRIRDRHQVAIGEALLSLLHPRWLARPEVPVYRPVRGVIDLVLSDPPERMAVASEIHSQLRRIEQQIRWSVQKADALAGLPDFAGIHVGRLLVLRNTTSVREAVKAAARTMDAAYPARAADALAALTGTGRWPGNAILWATVEGGRARILDGPPRGVTVGR